ncbi:707_t:CDS:2, partial [Gigaspora rosea]
TKYKISIVICFEINTSLILSKLDAEGQFIIEGGIEVFNPQINPDKLELAFIDNMIFEKAERERRK